jgi:hypothetical protein
MLARVTLMLENLPFFLQPGTKALNKGSIEFSNNSRIIAAATSGSSIRGMSVNLLYLDEFAFVERAAEFYTSTYPVVTHLVKIQKLLLLLLQMVLVICFIISMRVLFKAQINLNHLELIGGMFLEEMRNGKCYYF